MSIPSSHSIVPTFKDPLVVYIYVSACMIYAVGKLVYVVRSTIRIMAAKCLNFDTASSSTILTNGVVYITDTFVRLGGLAYSNLNFQNGTEFILASRVCVYLSICCLGVVFFFLSHRHTMHY